MKSTTLLASLLASVALAQPHGHGHGHQHRRSHHDRQAKRGVVTWVTETVYETVTAVVDDSTTELIMPSTKDTPTPSTSSTSSPSETASPGRFLEESKTKKSSSSSSAEPTTSQAPPPPVVESPPPPPPAETTSTAAPPVNVNVGSGSGSGSGSDSGSSSGTDTGSDSGSGSGSSSGGSETYTGDLTYFALGLGACGFDDSGKDHSENIVAVSSQLMGSQSNGNPFCDKTITVRAGSKTIQATVRDKCPSCAPGDIDGSEKMFLDLFGSLEAGRTKIDWWFN